MDYTTSGSASHSRSENVSHKLDPDRTSTTALLSESHDTVRKLSEKLSTIHQERFGYPCALSPLKTRFLTNFCRTFHSTKKTIFKPAVLVYDGLIFVYLMYGEQELVKNKKI